MAASSDGPKQQRAVSASSLKRSIAGSCQMQPLSPEGSTVYMTELSSDSRCDDPRHGNPVTYKGATLLGVPRKTQPQHNHSPSQTKSYLDNECSNHRNSTNLDLLTNQLSGLSVAKAVAREPSESDSSSSEDGEDVLQRAGVEDVDLDNVQAEPDGKAPIQLVSQFVSCLLRDEYEAAKILCEKVIELEPLNETAVEFYPLIQERIELDNKLPTESSSSESESEGDTFDLSTSSDSSEDGNEPATVGSENTHSHMHCAHATASWQP